MILNRLQIKRLRAESHRLQLKPVVMIGQNGLSEAVQAEIEIALAHHELIKIRIPALEKTAKQQMVDAICTRHGASLVQAIGNVMVIYCRNITSDRYAAVLKA